jgi:hypothetical protein
MKLTLTARALTSIAIVASTLVPIAVHAAESGIRIPNAAPASERSLAHFEGTTIDLSKNWGKATACWIDKSGSATCYRTEAEMDAAISATGKAGAPNVGPHGLRRASCSSSLRLYRNNYYGGTVLYLTQRYFWINLSWYGLNNTTSSYKVGGCSTTFRSGNSGSGSTYWGGTWAWASKSTMSGWDNVLSSVKIS